MTFSTAALPFTWYRVHTTLIQRSYNSSSSHNRSFCVNYVILPNFQISWGLWLAGEFYWPIRPGCVHAPAECQPQPSVPEDLGEFSPVAVKAESLILIISTKIQLGTSIYAVTDVVAECALGSDVKVRLLFRCCWGCWQAQRSSFPRGAAAWTPRSLTTSSHWPAARSGQ